VVSRSHQVIENGSMYSPEVLDLTDDDMVASFGAGLARIAALSMATGYPTLAAVPHMIINSYKNVLAIALETEYSFPQADKVKALLAK
jgi:large subunit ribosomal protein LP0